MSLSFYKYKYGVQVKKEQPTNHKKENLTNPKQN